MLKLVLWSKPTGLYKKLNIISNIITCNPQPYARLKERENIQTTISKWIIYIASCSKELDLCKYVPKTYGGAAFCTTSVEWPIYIYIYKATTGEYNMSYAPQIGLKN